MTTNVLERPCSSNSLTAVVELKLECVALPALNSLEDQVTRFQITRSPELFNQIATELLPSLEYSAKRFHARGGFPRFIEQADLVQYGSIGLIQAIESFDAGRGVAFRAFAARRIEGAMLDGIRGEDPMTRDDREKTREVKKSIGRLVIEGNYRPLEEEIRVGTSLSAESFAEIRRQMRACSPVSLDQATEDVARGGGESSQRLTLKDRLPDTDSPAADVGVIEAEMWEQLGLYLSARERYVIEGHLREGRQLCDIAKDLGVSRALVTHIKGTALERIREGVMSGALSEIFFSSRP